MLRWSVMTCTLLSLSPTSNLQKKRTLRFKVTLKQLNNAMALWCRGYGTFQIQSSGQQARLAHGVS